MPEEWIPLVARLGVRYVEISADNEIDPFFSVPEVLSEWRASVREVAERNGVHVATCFSGHGSYSTLGLGHYDARIRSHMRDRWARRMIELAGSFNAGMGCYIHAFDDRTLRNPARHNRAWETLISDTVTLAHYASESGVPSFSIEQMYSPHQPPWTLESAERFLKHANDRGAQVHLTLDTGHQCGQRQFLRPAPEDLAAYHEAVRTGGATALYLGCPEHEQSFRRQIRQGMSLREFEQQVSDFVAVHSHLFANPEDGDLYCWLERFARCSTIVHLQQNDGRTSSHHCFTKEHNSLGVVDRERVLRAIGKSFSGVGFEGGPPRPKFIFLVLEPFLPTACNTTEWLDAIEESVAYWREVVPEDGMMLEAALERLPNGSAKLKRHEHG